MSLNAICENKILAKISRFTVLLGSRFVILSQNKIEKEYHKNWNSLYMAMTFTFKLLRKYSKNLTALKLADTETSKQWHFNKYKHDASVL